MNRRPDPALAKLVDCSRCAAAAGTPCRWSHGTYADGEYHPERSRASGATPRRTLA